MRPNDVHALARFVRAQRKAQRASPRPTCGRGRRRPRLDRAPQAGQPRLEVSKALDVLDVLDALGAMPEVDRDRPRKSPAKAEAAASSPSHSFNCRLTRLVNS